MYSDKQIPVDMDTITVSFVIQSRHVMEGGAICLWHHVNWERKRDVHFVGGGRVIKT